MKCKNCSLPGLSCGRGEVFDLCIQVLVSRSNQELNLVHSLSSQEAVTSSYEVQPSDLLK
jgi:hypothetical protein